MNSFLSTTSLYSEVTFIFLTESVVENCPLKCICKGYGMFFDIQRHFRWLFVPPSAVFMLELSLNLITCTSYTFIFIVYRIFDKH